VAVPCDEPTLHLTVGLVPRTGFDFVQWLSTLLAGEEFIRRDLPHLNDALGQTSFLARFREAVTDVLRSDGLLRQFYNAIELNTEPRPAFTLPWSATPGTLPNTDSGFILLTSSRPPQIRQGTESGMIEVGHRGRLLSFNAATEPLFEFLKANPRVQVRDFYNRFEERFGRDQLAIFVADLVKEGVAAIVGDSLCAVPSLVSATTS
jgi:hypothetical protein